VGVGPAQGPHLRGEPFPDPLHGRLTRLDQQLAVAIPADVEPEELEAVFEADDARLSSLKASPRGASHAASRALTCSACSRL
jgi:hypothetical protein